MRTYLIIDSNDRTNGLVLLYCRQVRYCQFGEHDVDAIIEPINSVAALSAEIIIIL